MLCPYILFLIMNPMYCKFKYIALLKNKLYFTNMSATLAN